MDDLFRRIEFRAFSFEQDPDSLVDMHRCSEVLEGGWFDSLETCRMHHKMVVRSLGSSWVNSLSRAIISYADLVIGPGGDGFITRWRLHPDFRHPQVSKRMIQGLSEQARIRQLKGLVFFADSPEIVQQLEEAGLKRDRSYHWLKLDGEEPAPDEVEIRNLEGHWSDLAQQPWRLFLGTPFPSGLILTRSFMAADYGVFHHTQPKLIEVGFRGIFYPALHDGREWFVFRREKSPGDADAIGPVLLALGNHFPGRLLASDAMIEKSGMIPASDEQFWDFYLSLSD